MTLKDYKTQLEAIKALNGVERSYYSVFHTYLADFFASLNFKPQFIIEGSVAAHRSNMFPDFQVLNHSSSGLIGLIEAKDFLADISYLTKNKNTQIKKYLEHQPNLIVTNFDRLILLSLDTEKKKVIVLDDASLFNETEKAHKLLERFIRTAPNMNLGAFDIFCATLAYLANNLEIELNRVLKKELKNEESRFYDFFYNVLRGSLHLTNQEESKFAHSLIESYVFYQIFNQQLEIKIDILEELADAFLKKGIENVNDEKLSYAFQQLENFITKENTEGKKKFQQWVYQYQTNDNKQSLFTYFYEHFLSMWEKEINKDTKDSKKISLRQDLGVYYTPKPVVSFIVDAVNEILQKEFGFTTQPEIGLGSKQVELLDFATGTGTFLLEAIEQTFKLTGSRTQKQKEEDIASMMRRFYGFEIMITPWVLAKYNVRQKVNELLQTEEYNINDSKVFLTNTLESNSLANKLSLSLIEKFSENIAQANKIKKEKNIFVIMGNPPYNKDSQNKQKHKKSSTHNDNTFKEIEDLLKDYKPQGEKNIKTLSDDSIKFIRWGHNKVVKNKQGIVAVITPHAFLSGATFRQMRNTLMEDFDQIYILNLHGNNNTKRFEQDFNVFDIQTGVAITILVKTKEKSTKEECKVYYHELIGKRQEKFAYLEQGFTQATWQELDPLGFDAYLDTLRWGKSYNNLRFFVPSDELKQEINAYANFWGIADIFKEFTVGIGTYFDPFTINFTQAEAEEKIEELLKLPEQEFQRKYDKHDGSDWIRHKSLKEAKKHHKQKPYQPILYRPFDQRVIWYTGEKGIIARPRLDIMQHVAVNSNIYLNFTRFTNKDYYRHVFVSELLTDNHSISDKVYVAPLYLLPAVPKPSKKSKKESLDLSITEDTSPQLNFTPAFKTFFEELRAKWSATVVTPESLFAYIYAVLSTPSYQAKYNDLLSLDYPRVFFTDDQELFSKMAALGKKLIDCHTMDASALQAHSRSQAISLDTLRIQEELDKLDGSTTYDDKKSSAPLFVFKDGSSITIPSAHHDYIIGSYNVIKTFINARKDRPLASYRDELWQVILGVDMSLWLEKELDTALGGLL